jgi:hypothetical protein
MTVRRLGSVVLPLLLLVACDDPVREPTAPENQELSRQGSKAGVRFSTFNVCRPNQGGAEDLQFRASLLPSDVVAVGKA